MWMREIVALAILGIAVLVLVPVAVRAGKQLAAYLMSPPSDIPGPLGPTSYRTPEQKEQDKEKSGGTD